MARVRIFKAIAAMSENRVIGSANHIPWHLPEDFKWFKRATLGKTVLMGRRTFESLGKPLPNRVNLVLTRNPSLLAGGAESPAVYRGAKVGSAAVKILREAANSQLALPSTTQTELVLWGDLQKLLQDERGGDVWVIGGANVYDQTLRYCSDLYLTHVKRVVTGDAYFPPFESEFTPVAEVINNDEFTVVHYQHRSRLLA